MEEGVGGEEGVEGNKKKRWMLGQPADCIQIRKACELEDSQTVTSKRFSLVSGGGFRH